MALAVGVLPYPITFLCTDFISEIYGRSRANFVVWVGLGLNLWVVSFLWLGGVLPPEASDFDAATGLPPNRRLRLRVLPHPLPHHGRRRGLHARLSRRTTLRRLPLPLLEDGSPRGVTSGCATTAPPW